MTALKKPYLSQKTKPGQPNKVQSLFARIPFKKFRTRVNQLIWFLFSNVSTSWIHACADIQVFPESLHYPFCTILFLKFFWDFFFQASILAKYFEELAILGMKKKKKKNYRKKNFSKPRIPGYTDFWLLLKSVYPGTQSLNFIFFFVVEKIFF